MLQPKYTMNGLSVHDEMRANGSVHNRVLRVLLKSNLTLLRPQLKDAIAASFAKEVALGRVDPQGKTTILLSVVWKFTPMRLHRSSGFHDGKERGGQSKLSRLLWKLSV
jgi:hypothetical protein